MSAQRPPPPQLDTLPREIFLLILDRLPFESYISHAIAHYPLFRRRGLVPRMTRSLLEQLTNRAVLPYPLTVLPTEIMLQIMRTLPRRDVMAFVLANYRHLVNVGIAQDLTDADVQYLGLLCSA